MPSTEPRLSLLVAFLLFHALVTAAIPTPISGAQIRKNESSASEGGFFAEFTRPREGDTLVTGSVAEVRWETLEWDGAAMLEVAKGDGEAGHFIYVDYDLEYALRNYDWSIPESLKPGSYSLRLANSSEPSAFADSPIFQVIHAGRRPRRRPSCRRENGAP